MAIMKWKRASEPEAAFDVFDLFQDDWNRLLGWPTRSTGLFDRSVSPAVDMAETAEGVTIWFDVPGLDRKDLDLSVTGNVLTLKGEKKAKDAKQVYSDETWTGSFQRSLTLPDTVDSNKVSADFRDGVLRIQVAKKPEHKARAIAVAAR